jgi:probable phosphoglycerate mutase
MTKFILIRHATNDTVGKRLTGRLKGIHLNEEGREQSHKLAERLSGSPIKAIYSSPLERALETAEPIAKSLNLKTAIYDDFTDIEFGEWTNCTFEELKEELSFQHFNSFRSCSRIPGGELMIEAQARMINGLDNIRQQHPDETVAVISHADLIKAVIAFYAGIHLDMLLRIEVDPVSVSIIEVDDKTARILLVNHTGTIKL